MHNIDLGLLIITKDSIENLINAINSISPFVKQIVVVDTGSEDDTPIKATRLGAEVIFKTWNDNFSEVRNFGLAHMRTEWIISLDSDEVFDENYIDDLISTIENIDNNKNENVGGINILIKNALGEKLTSPIMTHRYTRIFRNLKNIRYIGRIHEQIRPSIENAGYKVVESNITIIHTGYQNTSKDKLLRNLKLLELEVLDSPNDKWLKYHLGETQFSLGNFDKALELYQNCVDSEELSLEQNERIHIRLAQIYLSKDNYTEMVKWLSFQSDNFDLEGLRRYVLAAGLLHSKKYSAALELYKSDEVQKSNYVDKEKLNDAVNLLSSIPGLL